jgi:hypothetical protein
MKLEGHITIDKAIGFDYPVIGAIRLKIEDMENYPTYEYSPRLTDIKQFVQ